MWDAVNGSLHSACTAGLQRLARIVEPHIASLDQEMRHVQVVLIDEGNAAGESKIGRAAVDALQASLTGFIGGMRLSCKDELNRMPIGVEQPGQPLFIMKDQLRTFVVREPSREANRQRVWIEQRSTGRQLRCARLLSNPAVSRMFTDYCEQVCPQRMP